MSHTLLMISRRRPARRQSSQPKIQRLKSQD
jgi:hypothetical protein